ncbi:MAG: hypothetical protein Kow0037_23360 [Calditrichia bacterium]
MRSIWILMIVFGLSSLLSAVDFKPEVKARLKAEGKLEKMARQYKEARERGLDQPGEHGLNLRMVPTEGTKRVIQGLIILVDFNDHLADTVNHPPAAFDELLFSSGIHPTGSMNDYYVENSNGKMSITGVITPWLRMPQNYTYYVNGQAGFGNYPNNAQKLVEDAIAAADPLVDFSLFDNDGDGYVDALFVVHSGPGRESSGSDNDIHSHAWSINPQIRDGVWIQRYSMEPETQGSGMVTMGVFSHEFGHVLGLPDLYDTDYSSSGVGNWSVMSGGSWGGGGTKPVHFDAWCKAQLGWIQPIALQQDSLNVEVPQIEGDSTVFRLWTQGQTGPEYFLIEYRKKTGFDVSLPGQGLLIWHIDETAQGNSNDWHRLVDLEQADGFFNLNTGSNSGDPGDPFPGSFNKTMFNGATTPNSHDYQDNETLVAVTNITDQGNKAVADLYVNYPMPLVGFKEIVINDSLGDNDGELDPGETVYFTVKLENQGFETQNVELKLNAPHGPVTLIDSAYTISSIPNGLTSLKNVFSLTVDANASNPSFAKIIITAENADLNESWDEVYTIGDAYGLQTGIEEDGWIWKHYAVSGGVDEWHHSTNRNHTSGGYRSYKLGGAYLQDDYASNQHAAVESPWLKTTANMELKVAMWYDIEASQTPGMAYDGGLVEVTTDGVNYTQITPQGGYTHQIINNPASPFPGGTPVFSGNSNGWVVYQFELNNIGPKCRIRFRFGSDAAEVGKGWYIDDVEFTPVVSIEHMNDGQLPSTVELLGNYPNPFNPTTTVRFALPAAGMVELAVYNNLGQKVKTLVSRQMAAGKYNVEWDGRNQSGEAVASGLYYAVLNFKGQRKITKMMLLK